MNSSTHIIRLGRTLALAAVVAGAALPAAQAGHRAEGQSPVARIVAQEQANDAVQVARYGPRDGWYGYAVSLTKASGNVVLDGRSPDTRDAALAAQAAKYGPLDGWYNYAVSLTKASGNAVLDGRSPDTRDAALAAQAAKYGPLDGWYNYAVSLSKPSGNAVLDGRSPDTRDAAFSAQQSPVLDGRSADTRDAAFSAQETSLSPIDGRSPDTVDAALLTHSPVVTIVTPGGFDWGDYGIGAGSGIGLILLFGGGLVLAYQRRHHRPQAA
jgi:hypothetical protein